MSTKTVPRNAPSTETWSASDKACLQRTIDPLHNAFRMVVHAFRINTTATALTFATVPPLQPLAQVPARAERRLDVRVGALLLHEDGGDALHQWVVELVRDQHLIHQLVQVALRHLRNKQDVTVLQHSIHWCQECRVLQTLRSKSAR